MKTCEGDRTFSPPNQPPLRRGFLNYTEDFPAGTAGPSSTPTDTHPDSKERKEQTREEDRWAKYSTARKPSSETSKNIPQNIISPSNYLEASYGMHQAPECGNPRLARPEREDSRMRAMVGSNHYPDPYPCNEKREVPGRKYKRLEDSPLQEEQGLQIPAERPYSNRRSPYPESEFESGGQTFKLKGCRSERYDEPDFGSRNIMAQPPTNSIIYSHPLNAKQLMVLKIPVENSQVQGRKNVLNIQIWSTEEDSSRSSDGCREMPLREKAPKVQQERIRSTSANKPTEEQGWADFTTLHDVPKDDLTKRNTDQEKIVRAPANKPREEPNLAEFRPLQSMTKEDLANYNMEQERRRASVNKSREEPNLAEFTPLDQIPKENVGNYNMGQERVRTAPKKHREEPDLTEYKTLHNIHEEDSTFYGKSFEENEEGEGKEGGGKKD
jgi:hypothetical protein